MDLRLRLSLLLLNLVLGAALLLGSPWILWQALFVPRRRTGLRERLGGVPLAPPGSLPMWIHAVSVGEVRAVSPLLRALGERLPGRPLVLSTVTVTGQATARRECPEVASVFYFPLDIPGLGARALSRVRPALFVTAETEVWPNFLSACWARRIPVAVVNGRLSDASFARYRRFRFLFAPFFARVELWLMQGEEDARRVRELGARPERVKVTGNTKYDRPPRAVEIPPAVSAWGGERFLLAGGSTHAGEEEALLGLLSHPRLDGLRLALAPRHPERFEEVARLLSARGIPFFRWSAAVAGAPAEGRVMLVDAMGVLDGVYALSGAAFVGGSLVPVGGHNLLEPAMHGIPVLTGPHTGNFRDITAALLETGGVEVAADGAALADAVAALVADPAAREEMGKRALAASRQACGSTARIAGELLELMKRGRGTRVDPRPDPGKMREKEA